MKRVLLFATKRPNEAALRQGLMQLAGWGAQARLVCWFNPDAAMRSIELISDIQRVIPVPARTAGWHRVLVGGRLVRHRAPARDGSAELWRTAKSCDWVRRHVRDADFLVALDLDAVYPVWEFARRTPGVRATYGLYAVWADLEGRIILNDGR